VSEPTPQPLVPELPTLAAFNQRLAVGPRRASAGAVAALAAGLASDLVAQVAERSPALAGQQGVLAQADALHARAAAQGGEVAAVYHRLVEALDDAVATGPSSPASAALGEQLDSAADLLVAIAETACDSGELALAVARAGDTIVRADAACAAVLAAAAAEIGARLVEINLLTSEGDERVSHARALMAAAAASRDAAVAGLA
jgi:hypothetical protein